MLVRLKLAFLRQKNLQLHEQVNIFTYLCLNLFLHNCSWPLWISFLLHPNNLKTAYIWNCDSFFICIISETILPSLSLFPNRFSYTQYVYVLLNIGPNHQLYHNQYVKINIFYPSPHFFSFLLIFGLISGQPSSLPFSFLHDFHSFSQVHTSFIFFLFLYKSRVRLSKTP